MSTLKITPDWNYLPDNSAEWRKFWATINPRMRQAMDTAFSDGRIGHRFRPLVARELRLLLWSMELHPGLAFNDQEGRAIGAHICPCECCQQRTCAFVLESGVEVFAQMKGDWTYVRKSDAEVEIKECTIGAYENCRQLTTASLAGNVALQVAEQVTKQVRTEVSRQLRSFFAEHTKTVISNQNRNSLIQSAFQQQSDMLRDEVQ